MTHSRRSLTISFARLTFFLAASYPCAAKDKNPKQQVNTAQMQSQATVTDAAQGAASSFADYSVCSLPPYAQDAFRKALKVGFFAQKAVDALTAAYNDEISKGVLPKNFPSSDAAKAKVERLFDTSKTFTMQEIFSEIVKNTDPDFKPTSPDKTLKLTKEEANALLEAVTDTAAQFAPANPPEHILCSESILSWNEASDVVGRRVANTYIVIQVVIRNLSADHEFLLHDVEALLNTGRFYTTHDHDVVRGVAEMMQATSPRNVAINTATAIGTSVGAAYGILSVNAKVGLNIWQSGVIPGLKVIFPDNTIRQVARIDSLAFSPGGSTMVIPKNSAVGVLAFLPQKQFLWPCVEKPPSSKDNSGTSKSKNAGGAQQSADSAGSAESDLPNPYECEPTPQIRNEKWLKVKHRDKELKDLDSAQMNRLQQSIEVLVAGVHVQEVTPTGTITDFTCDSSVQEMFKDSSVTCKVKGTNLDKVATIILLDPASGANGSTALGTVQANAGDNTAGSVSFPACQLNNLTKSTYQVSIVATGGNLVQKATFAKGADALAPTCTAAVNGNEIDCGVSKMSAAETALIDSVTLSQYNGTTFNPAIVPQKLDSALKPAFRDPGIKLVLTGVLPSTVTMQALQKSGGAAIDTCVTPTPLVKK